jgi:hypothetical protein
LFPRTGLLSIAYLQAGRNPDAVASTEKWKQPGHPGAWYWAATAYVDAHIGKMDDARAALRN